ncbi:hypothetical protein ALI144C_37460 [Actinosynnema sp. ALI-1.44]|uniref:selenium-binding protein SBP56-related protein n=1 Tax=Actinosynnema sp. ALI-1.44 TaxID=1933779 RepID=UPI00097CB539|nr:selenium-binding protein SBP56-related protein [Actinosynnema sp. ALI-1.44]ONI76345.1 hypothetical protein ALI144C_37460 [Actinosynnema sp. ALI-1.44]
MPIPVKRHRTAAVPLAVVLLAGVVSAGTEFTATAEPGIVTVSSSLVGSDGKSYAVTNHLTPESRTDSRGPKREWLLVWAGDAAPAQEAKPDPDFLAVVDATPHSRHYGKVVNTVTIDSAFGNEPHHMQYMWHKGQRVYAGGLLSDTTYVFDVSKLPEVKLAGVTLPADTPCGSAPDAYWVLKDGTAYASYMGGPDVTGPCRYTNGEVRDGNGFAGSPGEIVHIGPDGKVLAEMPAASRESEDPKVCPNIPALPRATCANPHGIQVREDLGRAITSDFAEVRNLIPHPPTDPYIGRDTVRTFDISNRSDAKLVSTSRLPDGPRQEPDARWEEPRAVMEVTVTNQRRNKGAFAGTMGGGAVYYTPDITAANPRWRQVFDDAAAFRKLFPVNTPTSESDGGSWLQVSPDDRFLFHIVLQGGPRSPRERETGMVYVLDIQQLLAAGGNARCTIDEIGEVTRGGREPDCPKLVDALPIRDTTSGGPHWGALDNFRLGSDGKYHETSQVRRLATANYFVSAVGADGDHRVCMIDVSHRGTLSLDRSFGDQHSRTPCVDFDRARWPHGAKGGAKPHGVLFAVADADVR